MERRESARTKSGYVCETPIDSAYIAVSLYRHVDDGVVCATINASKDDIPSIPSAFRSRDWLYYASYTLTSSLYAADDSGDQSVSFGLISELGNCPDYNRDWSSLSVCACSVYEWYEAKKGYVNPEDESSTLIRGDLINV
jgi:hypothetical protein